MSFVRCFAHPRALRENESETAGLLKDLGGDLPFHHAFSLRLRRSTGSLALVPTHIPAYDLSGAMDRVRRCAHGRSDLETDHGKKDARMIELRFKAY